MFDRMHVRRIPVGVKFALIVTSVSALIAVAAVLLVAQRLRAQDRMKSEAVARATADHVSQAVARTFADAFAIVDNTLDDIVALKDDGVTDPQVFDTLLKRALAGGDRYGAWLAWDGADAPGGASLSRRDPSGRFVTYWHQNGMEMLRDGVPAEIFASDLFRVPREQAQPFLLDPHAIDAVAGDPTLVTSFAKPLEHDGKVTGVLAVDLKLDAIAEAISAIDLPEGAALAVVAGNGRVAMATDPGWAGRPVADVNPRFARLFANGRRGDGAVLGESEADRVEMLDSWRMLRFAGVESRWYLLMRIPEDSLLASGSGDAIVLSSIFAGALLALLGLVLFAMRRMVALPLRRLSGIINGLGNGLFDFEVPHQGRRDEIGDIARGIERLQASGLEIARLQEENGEREFQRSVVRRAELDDISLRFSQSIEAVAASLQSAAGIVGTQSSELSSTVHAAVRRLGKVAEASDRTRSRMGDAAGATVSLLRTIEQIGDQTVLGRGLAEKVESSAASTDLSIADLRRTVGTIDRVTKLIAEVASQINLIALNATIEAARAGPAGLGFAVVAQEIKVLANRTGVATAEIARHIAAVHGASASADEKVADMKRSFAAFQDISRSISSSLEVQMETTGAIRELTEQAVDGSAGVARTMGELVAAAAILERGTDVVQSQSATLGHEIGKLNDEVARFIHFLKAA